MSLRNRLQIALTDAARYMGPLEEPMLRALSSVRYHWRHLLAAADKMVDTDPKRARRYAELAIRRSPTIWKGHVIRCESISATDDHGTWLAARLTAVMLISSSYLPQLDEAWFEGETGADRMEMARRCDVPEQAYPAVALDISNLGGEKAGPIGLKRLVRFGGLSALPLSQPIISRLDPEAISSLAQELWSMGNVEYANRLLDSSPNLSGPTAISRRVTQDMAVLKGELGLKLTQRQTYERDPDLSFYLLHNSLPHKSNGYAMRSHGLIGGMRRHGRTMVPITRPGFPPMEGTFDQDPSTRPEELVDGIVYHRLLGPVVSSPRADIQGFVDGYSDAMESLVQRFRPSLIHAASNWWNGLAAVATAHKYDIPSLYEIRGLWEITRSSRDDWADTDAFRVEAAYESLTSNLADHLVVITEGLKSEMIARGVSEEAITVVPNAVDVARFHPMERDRELQRQLGLEGACVIGFVGTFTHYEGLDDLLEAAARLKSTTSAQVKYLFVGDGPEQEDLVRLTEDLGLERDVRFAGRVRHGEVHKYMSLIDITPFPRKPLPVTELVSPLKPLESMASGIPVIASDVAALKEIVPPGVGVLHEKGSVASLAMELTALIEDPTRRRELAANAREWVVENRTWSAVSGPLVRIYAELTGR